MTDQEDEDYNIVDLDLPPTWTQEEIRGVRRFVHTMMAVAHIAERDHVRASIVRAGLHTGLDLETLELPKIKRKRRIRLPDGTFKPFA